MLGRNEVSPTLQQIQSQQEKENAFGGDLNPPSVEEREEDDSDDALPGQGRPRTLWLGLGKRWTWEPNGFQLIIFQQSTEECDRVFPVSVVTSD